MTAKNQPVERAIIPELTGKKSSGYTASSPRAFGSFEYSVGENGDVYSDDDFDADTARMIDGKAELRDRIRKERAGNRPY